MGARETRASDAVVFDAVTFAYADGEGQPLEPVVQDVSLAVPRGQCVVITGPSGCGKTTMVRLMNGLAPQVYDGELRGSVHVLGEDAARLGVEGLAHQVGSVFQNPRSQFFNLDTTSEIAFGCENAGLPRDEIHRRVYAAASDLGIERLLDRDIRALSGGQRQMVALASVHALGPEVFALDEPTAALDVSAMRTLTQLVLRLKELGRTVIISEHRLWWLRGVADRVVHIDAGHVAHDWTTEEFERLDTCALHAMGLRAWRIEDADADEFCPTANRQQCPPDAVPPLSFSSLYAGYGRSDNVVRAADGAFKPHCVTALVGGNGAGKSTLARCLAGLHRERSGNVVIQGSPVPYRKRAGRAFLVMQEPGYQLFAHTAEHELVTAAARRRGSGEEAESAARDALERFGLTPVAQRHPLSLSGGERQRLAIAVGVLQGASSLVLDEPTSGLDYRNMMSVSRELARARDAGTCVAVITHDYEFISAVCDEVAVMADGRFGSHYALEPMGAPRLRRTLGFAC